MNHVIHHKRQSYHIANSYWSTILRHLVYDEDTYFESLKFSIGEPYSAVLLLYLKISLRYLATNHCAGSSPLG